jgi:hypothetical protein
LGGHVLGAGKSEEARAIYFAGGSNSFLVFGCMYLTRSRDFQAKDRAQWMAFV